MGDNIMRPDHYCEGREYEPKDVIRDWGLNFNLGSSVKYISRAGRKGDILEDLRKAKQFLEFEIEALAEGEDLKCIVKKIDNGELTADDIPTELYSKYKDIRDAIARQAMPRVRNLGCENIAKEHKDDIGMTCKEAAAIGDAMAKGFKEGFKEAEENSDIEIERKTSWYTNGVLGHWYYYQNIPDGYKARVIDRIAQEVLDSKCDIDQNIPSDEVRAAVIDHIVEMINNEELTIIDIPTNLYTECARIRAAISNLICRKIMDGVRKYAEDTVSINFEFEVDPDIDTDTVNVHVHIKNKED